MSERNGLSDMSRASRNLTLHWAAERVLIPHESPARRAAVMLLDLARACAEVAKSSIDDGWLRDYCYAALHGQDKEASNG